MNQTLLARCLRSSVCTKCIREYHVGLLQKLQLRPTCLRSSLCTKLTREYHVGFLQQSQLPFRRALKNSVKISNQSFVLRLASQTFESNFSRTLQMDVRNNTKHKTVLFYLTSAAVLACGLSYAAVPLYRLYCQASGYAGTTKRTEDIGEKIQSMERVKERMLTIRFEAGTSKKLLWRFKPQQREVKVAPGETALAFYTAENLTDRPIIGIATYNVVPFETGQYFNKIQCFCFEEQQLNPHEQVDMPVFFYIDPDFVEDPKMAKIDEIILSYTFFESSNHDAPLPTPHSRS